MKQLWLPVFLVFSTGHLYAQNTWQLSGHVRNEAGEPLPGSLVQINDSTGIVADVEGYFQIESSSRPGELTARCLGYFPRRILLQNSDFQDKKAQIEVALTDQEMTIQEVSITAKKVEVLAKENFSTDIYDYAFAGENLLLLVRERKRYFVRLMNEAGEQIDELQLAGQPNLLHRSCTGSLHLAGDAFAQELTVNGLHLDTFPRYSLQQFRQFVVPCVQQSRGYYFFKVNGLFNKSVTYFYFDPERKRH
ncbi:MAG TPA: carboxypeptidase-like regulatory domain-containing protein, partial [Saprospiraceae bacterium]|nr:carboxypeptidase-like regulatory domain-containing protein [Saprospiraceae bacterium]